MLKIKATGLDKAIREIRKLHQKARALDGQHSVPVTDLLNRGFLRKHTRFTSLDDLVNASGFKVESPEDFEAIPDAEWEKFIRENTPYASWDDMLQSAAGEWVGGKLGLRD